MGEFLFVDVSTKEAIESHIGKDKASFSLSFLFSFRLSRLSFYGSELAFKPTLAQTSTQFH